MYSTDVFPMDTSGGWNMEGSPEPLCNISLYKRRHWNREKCVSTAVLSWGEPVKNYNTLAILAYCILIWILTSLWLPLNCAYLGIPCLGWASMLLFMYVGYFHLMHLMCLKKTVHFFYYEEFKVNKYICRDYFMNKAANAHGM